MSANVTTTVDATGTTVAMTTTNATVVMYSADGRIFVDQSVLYSVVLATLFSGILAL
jgi:hypothetical protein